MTLRARLALVLAGLMVGPLVAAWAVIGVLAPRAVSDFARQSAAQTSNAVKQDLAQLCLGVGDTLATTANRLLAGAVVTRSVSAQAAGDAAAAAALRRTGLQVVVLGPELGPPLAVAGPIGPEVAARAATAQLDASASCSQGRILTSAPALAESMDVRLTGGPSGGSSLLARVVVWMPVDDAMLARRSAELGLPTDDGVLLTTANQGFAGQVLAGTLPESRTIAVASAAVAGESSGLAAGHRFEIRQAWDGVPFDVIGLSRALDLGRLQWTLLGVVTATAAGSVLLVWVLAGRLTAPLEHVAGVADRLRSGDLAARTGLSGRDEVGRLATSFDAMAGELERTVGALRERSRALSEMFDTFGQALGRSHDLDGLVRTVLDAALLGSDAAVGLVLLGDVGGLQVRACQAAQGRDEPAPEVADALGALATLSVERREAVLVPAEPSGRPAPGVVLPAGLSGALALPMMKGDRVFGALTIARDGGEPFDPATAGAIRALAGQAGTAVANVRQHEETRRQSVTDPLTGAGNFRHLSATLAREVERATRFGHPLAVLMLDLDHFKQVNDTLGHGFGDAVLREFARRLQQCLREVDTVARYGGEEFCVIAPETDVAGARRVADRIVEVVRSEPFTVGERSRRVTVSVGVASYPEHGSGAAELMGAADAALYAAKRTGRDRWVLAGASGGTRAPVR